MNDKKRAARRPWFAGKVVVMGLVLSAATIGCGGPDQASVSGKVTYNGEPVHGGTLIFGPAGEGNVGRPASATIKADGTYVLGTSGATDGALVAKHRVSYTCPPQVLTKEQESDHDYVAPPPPYAGMVPKQLEVQVKSGRNKIDIELVPGSPQ
jgi:hypothetical protein